MIDYSKFIKMLPSAWAIAVLALALWAMPVELRAQEVKEQEQLQVLQSLNQIAVSLTHIMTYNDKVVLDQEYNTIINNLNLSKIPDADIITLLQELMDLLVSSKISDHERDYLLYSYDKNVQNELKERVRARIFETDILANPYTTLLNAFLSTGSFYFNYRAQMNAYKKEKEEGLWAIEAKTMQALNTFFKKLLKYSWDLMRRYNFPDEWRLDEKQITDYTAILKESDAALRYRKLERIEDSFHKFPPYWYYRGNTAMELGKKEEALRCFTQFQKIHQGILRKDPYAASTAMSKTMLMGENAAADALKSDLEAIVANSEDADWGNILFAALQCARSGDAETAGKLILRNLDNGHTAFIDSPDMIRAVGPALLLNARPEVFNRIMDTVLQNDQVKNYDLLYLYGQIRNRDILKRIQPEFDRVLLLSADKSLLNPINIFRDDNVSLFLPTRWIAENIAIKLHFKSEEGEKDFYPDQTALLPNFPEMTVMTFKNVFSIKTYLKKKRSAEISIALVREKLVADKREKEVYDIEMLFATRIMPATEQLTRIVKYSNYLYGGVVPDIAQETRQPDPDARAVWFGKEKIVLNGETFKWGDDGIVFN